MKILFIPLLFLLSTNIFAMKIQTIKFDGLYHISEPVALRMLDFKVGDDIDESDIDRAIKTYFEQTYFRDIWVDYNDKGELLFNFVERAIITKVELEGYKDDDDSKIKDSVLQIKKGSLYDKKKLESAKKRLMALLSQEGKIDSVVEIESEFQENGSVKIKFLVNVGEEITITKLTYSGVKGVDSDEFDEVIANKESEFMGWLWLRNDGEMELADLGYDHYRIKDYYMQFGFLDADVKPPFVRVNFDSYTAEMSYQIKEGEAYSVSGIEVMQSKNVILNEKIKDILKLEVGDVFNIKTFRKDSKKIKTLIADLGYAFVKVVPDLQKDEKNHTVKVVYKVIPGEKVYIRNVIIAGNSRTLDRMIRRELYLGSGDMYSLTDLKDSKNAIGRLGYFEGTTIEERRIDANTMDLIVKVKETPTGNIQLGGGYGSYGGWLLNLAVSDTNVWGSGINLGVQAEKSELSQNYSFNISNPRLNDSDFSGNFSIGVSSNEYDYYTANSETMSIGSGHRLTRHLSIYVGYSWSQNIYTDVDNSAVSNNTYYFESYLKNAIYVNLSFDNTDDYYLPREGISASQRVEYAGLSGDAKFYKTKTTFNAYRGLREWIDFDIITRYKARYNFVYDNGYLPIIERFRIGGMGSIRGHESYSISPMVGDQKVGGTSTFSNSLELSLPLIPKAKMRLLFFLDWGWVKGEKPELASTTGDFIKDEDARSGYGGGIEWFSPVGPIQILFSRAIDPLPHDNESTFEFSMGRRF